VAFRVLRCNFVLTLSEQSRANREDAPQAGVPASGIIPRPPSSIHQYVFTRHLLMRGQEISCSAPRASGDAKCNSTELLPRTGALPYDRDWQHESGRNLMGKGTALSLDSANPGTSPSGSTRGGLLRAPRSLAVDCLAWLVMFALLQHHLH
jgi:hypothetical protein